MKLYTPHPTHCGPALLALCLGLSSLASAATYTMNLRAEDASHIGKYTADPDGSLEAVLANYSTLATSDGGSRFWTFCLESQVYFEPNRTYNAEVSSMVDSPGGGDPLSNGTAYLYEKFALGQLGSLMEPLGGFTYDLNGGIRLQNMIWWLEDEVGGAKDEQMWTHLGSTLGNDILSNYGDDAVKVLNLTKYDGVGGDTLGASYGTLRQDQLVYLGPSRGTTTTNRVPDGGTTLLLLGSAVGGLGLVRRWNQKDKS